MQPDIAFADHLKTILDSGSSVSTRNSVTKRVKNLTANFNTTPLISARKTAWKNALREMEWFLSGSNNIKDLHPSVHHWWQPWATSEGLITNNYSIQFRNFAGQDGSLDSLEYLLNGVKYHPFSRRNVITTWNTADMASSKTPITNCHGSLIQALVEPHDKSLHLTMIQRSADMVLGVPHNWIQYWALLLYLAHHTNTQPGTLFWHGVDCHIYSDHEDAAKQIISADKTLISTPMLRYNSTSSNFKADDFSLEGEYKPLLNQKLNMTV